jgi:hypothetical protein
LKPLIELAPQVLSAFKKRSQRRLRKLNDRVLKASAMQPTKVNLSFAIFSYVLSKIASKPRLLRREYEPQLRGIENVLEKLVKRMGEGSEEEILLIFSELEKAIASLEREDPRFVVGLVKKGKLKMAATFYAQGMSLGIASDMTGLEKQEIMDYAGHTMMFDRVREEKSVTERMKDARRLISG